MEKTKTAKIIPPVIRFSTKLPVKSTPSKILTTNNKVAKLIKILNTPSVIMFKGNEKNFIIGTTVQLNKLKINKKITEELVLSILKSGSSLDKASKTKEFSMKIRSDLNII